KRKREAPQNTRQRAWIAGSSPLWCSFKLHRGDMERYAAPRGPGHAANQNGPKTYSKVNLSHASGDVCDRRRRAQASLVRGLLGPELYTDHLCRIARLAWCAYSARESNRASMALLRIKRVGPALRYRWPKLLDACFRLEV